MKMQNIVILVFLLIVLFQPVWGQNATLTGTITTPTATALSGVEVRLLGESDNLIATQTTAANGRFDFDNLNQGETYTLTFSKSDAPLNGVSTFDAVVTARHILGITFLSTPEKILAADVNLSGAVTTLDILQMRRLILNIDQAFPILPSWRFISADLDLSDPNASPNDNNTLSVTLDGTTTVQNIKGIKLGDLNDSVIP